MDATDLARWQFAITTVYHFLFVPITIGTSLLIAGIQTAWVRTGNPAYLRLTKFLGKLFLINFALGLVTGIVQEFQFGMNWSDYSRFVGDIFGAPLAFEALLSFFLESTFLGIWIFGWDRLPKKLHLASIWCVAIGTMLSAYFILAANSFMQNPVGYKLNPATGRAEMTDFLAVLTNPVQLVTFPHTITAAWMTAGGFVMAACLYHLYKGKAPQADLTAYRNSARIGAVVCLIGGLLVAITGDLQGKVMTEKQPMKMAAAEALYQSEQPAGFSAFTIGSLDGSTEKFAVKVPGLLSFLATGSFDGKVEGINDLKAEYDQKYGQTSGNDASALAKSPTDYVPTIPLTYWTFRLMIGLGLLAAAISAAMLWVTRKKNRNADGAPVHAPLRKYWLWAAIAVPLLPVCANSAGWIFTEVGRQPWLVFGLMTTANGVSPSVSTGEVLISMIVFTLLYGALAVVEITLLLRYLRHGLPAEGSPELTGIGPGGGPDSESADRPMVFSY